MQMRLQADSMGGPGAAHPRTGRAAPALARRYDRLCGELLQRYAASRTRTAQALWGALDAAAASLQLDGSTSADESRAVRDCVSRDLAQLATVLVRGTREEVTATVALAAAPGSLQALMQVLRLSGDGVFRIANGTGHPEVRRAGESTCAGRLACAGCGAATTVRQTSVVQPCSACGNLAAYKLLRG